MYLSIFFFRIVLVLNQFYIKVGRVDLNSEKVEITQTSENNFPRYQMNSRSQFYVLKL
jgi:hypothetical protein